jgi:energy-coupling factor transporter ATP-binding protein EcfA2
MQDLFHALGYHDFKLNIPKSGREIDLRGTHRTTGYAALAECKATSEPIGGADLNKFAGILEVERAQAAQAHLDGYFISLNGYKASALEQESGITPTRFIMMTGEDVVRELIAGSIVVPPEGAAAAAGKCAGAEACLNRVPHLELLACHTGWCWCVTFRDNAGPAAFVLVHADGAPLGGHAAADIIAADAAAGGPLTALTPILPESNPSQDDDAASALIAYRDFLGREYGRITVDGLPADEQVGSKSIALADLFVPVHLQPVSTTKPVSAPADESRGPISGADLDSFLDGDDELDNPSNASAHRDTLGSVIARGESIAVLGPPGCGKSTLLKRLAIAYGVPAKRTEIADDLPDRDWLPFVIRCRQLDAVTTSQSFHDILQSIPARAEMPQHAEVFRAVMETALRDGTALILVDGLDEIADPQVRLAFVKQLRTFVSTYPAVQLVVTSREAGFRIVAGALCDVSTSYRVADFDNADIGRLTVAWAVLVSGDTETARAEALEIARAIVQTDRVRRLARNPLLLTTLLLVRRWLGDMPKKRTALYAKAIEVLLMTWNVEGHQPIDLEEATPQLAYVAFAMTRDKAQVLSRPHLIELLEEARAQMPEVLGHSPIAPGAFLERIEDRSSLLSLSGHAEENGLLVPLYEFKHLTFQEYLAAVAVAEGYYPDRTPADTPESVIFPRLREQQWLEVIPMIAVLVGRRATPIVEALIDIIVTGDPSSSETAPKYRTAVTLLSRCLGDEAQIPPATVVSAASALSMPRPPLARPLLRGILSSKYRHTFHQALADGFLGGQRDFWTYGSLLANVATEFNLGDDAGRWRSDWANVIAAHLSSASTIQGQAEGGLMAMIMLFEGRRPLRGREPGRGSLEPAAIYDLEATLRPSLESSNAAVRYAVAWAYAWLGQHDIEAHRYVPKSLPILYRLWKGSRDAQVKRHMAWAFACQPLLPRSRSPLGAATQSDVDFIEREAHARRIRGRQREDRRPAALVASYYFGGPYVGLDLRERVSALARGPVGRERLLRRRL